MIITNETKLIQKSVMFMDGAKGVYVRLYNLFADGKETGVSICATGNKGQTNGKRVFIADDHEYDNPQKAFEAAGHEWRRK